LEEGQGREWNDVEPDGGNEHRDSGGEDRRCVGVPASESGLVVEDLESDDGVLDGEEEVFAVRGECICVSNVVERGYGAADEFHREG